jgi:SAM-dependent methyltransferase
LSRQVDRQRRFYESRPHEHLQARADDYYAAKLVRSLVAAAGIGPDDDVLEVGAGFGRFTFELLGHCRSVVALDLAPTALERLAVERDARGISRERLRTRCADLTSLEADALGERFRFVVGFFLLHHLEPMSPAIHRLATFLAPAGTLAFVEPNRRNPLFLAQVACCADMTWAEESGMFRLSARDVLRAFRSAGLAPGPVEQFGFFPPQLLNRSSGIQRLEAWLERRKVLQPVLPFLLLRARNGTG